MATYLDSHSWGRIIAKAWLEPEFKNLLETDPAEAVKQFAATHNLNVSYDALSQIENRPSDLTDEQLQDIVDGKLPYPNVRQCC